MLLYHSLAAHFFLLYSILYHVFARALSLLRGPTCAPRAQCQISCGPAGSNHVRSREGHDGAWLTWACVLCIVQVIPRYVGRLTIRSEERRVGKECRYRWAQ